MTAPILNHHHHDGLITRRSIFVGAAVSLLYAPAIVRATSLMPVQPLEITNWASVCRVLRTFNVSQVSTAT